MKKIALVFFLTLIPSVFAQTAKPAPAGALHATVYPVQEGFVDANDVLAREKQGMEPEARQKLQAFEDAGLFGKGKPWERNRYPNDYAVLAWGDGYFPFLYQNHPDPNYDPAAGNTSTSWELYREMWGSHGEFVIDGNLKSVEYTDRLSGIHVPTLVMCGDHDESDPSLSHTMHDKIAGSKLVIFPKSGQ